MSAARPRARLGALAVAAAVLAIGLFCLRVLAGPVRGLRAEYFTTEHADATAAFEAVEPSATTVAVQRRWRGAAPQRFRVRWTGHLAVSRGGTYTIATTSDDASFVWVDGRAVVDNGGLHSPQTRSGTVTLDRGSHFVQIELVQYNTDYAIDWRWARDGGALETVPAWALTPRFEAPWRVMAAHVVDVVAALAATVALVLIALVAWQRRPWFTRYPRAAVLLLFAALAVVHTWPLATDPGHLTRHDNRDTILNEWIVAWVAHQAPRAPAHVFDANIFYPDRHTLAYSEPLIPQAILGAPLLWLGASPVFVYGVLLMAGFALTGWSMALVVRAWTGDWTAGLVAGAAFAFNAHTLTRLPHLQAQHVEFLPAALYAFDLLVRQPAPGRAVRLAAWFTAQALTSVYLLVFSAFALIAAAIARVGEWRRAWRRTMAMLALAAALAALALVPALVPYWQASREQGLTRSLGEALLYAAQWRDYLSTPSRLHYPWWSHRFFAGTALFPGALALILAIYAIARGALADPRARMCFAVAAVGVVMSLGPALPGYAAFYSVMPLLWSIRGTARFGYLLTLGTAVLAGYGVIAVRRLAPERAWKGISIVLVLIAAFEGLAAPIGLSRFDGIPPIYARVPRTPGTVVVELPFFSPANAQYHAAYMLNSTEHWQPIVNGYSGFIPPSFLRHAETLQTFPDSRAVAMLHEIGVTHVFVHTGLFTPDALDTIDKLPDFELMERFGTIALYRMR